MTPRLAFVLRLASFHAPAAALVLTALAAPASASPQGEVWVVDAALGAGADFATIQEAVDAASTGDTVLVRSGTYDAFLVSSKTLAVVADTGASVRVVGGPRVIQASAGPANVLHGLSFEPDPIAALPAAIGTGVTGPATWVSDCSITGNWLLIQSLVVLDHCTFQGPAGGTTPWSIFGQHAVESGIAFVAAFSSSFEGGAGRDASPSGEATYGGAGVKSESGGAFWAANSTIQGGAGGAGTSAGGCQPGADGGHGYVLKEGWLFESASALAGGSGGAAAPGCPGTPGADGSSLVVTPVYGMHAQIGPAPVLMAPGVAREGQTVTFDYEGPAGLGVLMLGGSTVFQQTITSPLGDDSMPLLVGGPRLFGVFGALAAPGTASIGLTVPNLPGGVESARIYAQALHVDLTTFAIHSGGARAVVLLDAAF